MSAQEQSTKSRSEISHYNWVIDPTKYERDGDIAPDRTRRVLISNGPTFGVAVHINDFFVGGLDPRQEKFFDAAPGQPVEVRLVDKGETESNFGQMIFLDA